MAASKDDIPFCCLNALPFVAPSAFVVSCSRSPCYCFLCSATTVMSLSVKLELLLLALASRSLLLLHSTSSPFPCQFTSLTGSIPSLDIAHLGRNERTLLSRTQLPSLIAFGNGPSTCGNTAFGWFVFCTYRVSKLADHVRELAPPLYSHCLCMLFWPRMKERSPLSSVRTAGIATYISFEHGRQKSSIH